MRKIALTLTMIIAGHAYGQTGPSGEEKWGIVLEHPAMNDVVVTRGIEYSQKSGKPLQLDIYTPPQLASNEVRGGIVFLTELNKDRSWEIYRTWPKLAAAYGLIGISVDVDKEHYLKSVRDLFKFVSRHSNTYHIDTNRLGVYIPSHVPHDVIVGIIVEQTSPPVKAAVLFNSGPSLKGPFRKDLPVFYVTDDQVPYTSDLFTPIWNEVQKTKAPWTIRFGTGMPIFFEAFEDTDEAKKIIREAVYFLKNHLEPLPTYTNNPAEDRTMIAALYRADYTLASVKFKQWLDNHPDDQYALNKYAMISFMQKNYVEAEQAYRRVKDLHPVYRIDLVKVLLANNKEAEATRELTLAIRSGKVKRSPYPGIATFLYSLGRFGQGVTYYEMASEHDLKGEDFYNMARGYAKINEIDKAIRALEKSIELKFPSAKQIENDTDLFVLRSDNRYRQLLNRIQ